MFRVSVDPGFNGARLSQAGVRVTEQGHFTPQVDAFLLIVRTVALQTIQRLHNFFRVVKTHDFTGNDRGTRLLRYDQTGKADGQVVQIAGTVADFYGTYPLSQVAVEVAETLHQAAVKKEGVALSNRRSA